MAEKILVETKFVNEKLEGTSIVTNMIDLSELDFKNPKESPIKTVMIKGPKGDDPYNLMKYKEDFYKLGYKPESEQDILEIICYKLFEEDFEREDETIGLNQRGKKLDFNKQSMYVSYDKGNKWEPYEDVEGSRPCQIKITPVTAPMTVTHLQKTYKEFDEVNKELIIDFKDGLNKENADRNPIKIINLKKEQQQLWLKYKRTFKSEGYKNVPADIKNKNVDIINFGAGTVNTLSRISVSKEKKVKADNGFLNFRSTGRLYLYLPEVEELLFGMNIDFNGYSMVNLANSTMGNEGLEEEKIGVLINAPKLKFKPYQTETLIRLTNKSDNDQEGGKKYNSLFRIMVARDGIDENTEKALGVFGLTKHQTTNEFGQEIDDWYDDEKWAGMDMEKFLSESIMTGYVNSGHSVGVHERRFS